MKAKLIILEGVDRSGKGSLQLAINKLTKYKHLVIDRGPTGFLAYIDIFNKNTSKEEYLSLEQSLLCTNHLMVYIDCSDEELKRRCNETNHEYIDYELHKKYYEEAYKSSKLNKVKVDSSNKTPEEIVMELINKNLI